MEEKDKIESVLLSDKRQYSDFMVFFFIMAGLRCIVIIKTAAIFAMELMRMFSIEMISS